MEGFSAHRAAGSCACGARVLRGHTGLRRSEQEHVIHHAYHQPARTPRSPGRGNEVQVAGDAELAAASRGLHPRLHHDAEEAELRAAQGGQGAADQRLRSHLLHWW